MNARLVCLICGTLVLFGCATSTERIELYNNTGKPIKVTFYKGDRFEGGELQTGQIFHPLSEVGWKLKINEGTNVWRYGKGAPDKALSPHVLGADRYWKRARKNTFVQWLQLEPNGNLLVLTKDQLFPVTAPAEHQAVIV